MKSRKRSGSRDMSTGVKERKRLRVGVLIDDINVQSWVFELLKSIDKSDYAELAQVVVRKDVAPGRKSIWLKVAALLPRLGYIVYSRLDKLFSRVFDDPCRIVSAGDLLEKVPRVDVKPIRSGAVERFSDEDVQKLRSANADVFLRLGFGILKGDVLEASKYGIWSFHHGDMKLIRGMPPGIWEAIRGESVLCVSLQKLNEELDGGEILHQSFTASNKVYVYRGLSELYWKSATVLPNELRKLNLLGADEYFSMAKRAGHEPSFYSNQLFSFPSNLQMLKLGVATAYRFFRLKVLARASSDQWRIMYRSSSSQAARRALWRYKELVPPDDRFWADPFVVERGSDHYIFFEELIYTEDIGTIAYLTVDRDGNTTDPITILRKPYHLSYPFVFEHEGSYYMVPETAENRSVDLYVSTSFPDEWKFKMTLLEDLELVDATLLQHNGRWWIFGGQRGDGRLSISEELHLYYSDNLFSDTWTAHPCNPVVSDVRCGRPAGAIFEEGGSLFRPAQDCSDGYGGRIEVRRIVELTTTHYREEPSTTLNPAWRADLQGLHTLNSESQFSVIDVLVRKSRFNSFIDFSN